MGSTNRTTNYELSQFVGNDKPSWLSDYNGDMAKIDTAIKARSVEAGAAQTTADTANGKADALETRMGTAENNITALQNASTTDHTQIATNTANISKNAQDIVQLDAKIGHTQITIGDHTVTGAIATLASQGGVEADNVSYDNTTSGLTADDVQEAIDELAARPTVADASDVTFDNTGTTLQATNVEDAIKEVASTPASNNVRYNETTDFLQCLVNGSWVNAIYLALKSFIIYLAGTFNYAMEISTHIWSGYTAETGHIAINANDISLNTAGFQTVSKGQAMISQAKLAVSGKKLKIDFYLDNDTGNIQTLETVNVLSADSYVVLSAIVGSDGTHYIAIEGCENANLSTPTTGSGAFNMTSANANVAHVTKIYAE